MCETHVAVKIYWFILCQMAFLDRKSFPTIGYFFKMCFFRNTGWYLDRRLPQDAAAEASKSHRVYTNSSNCIKHIFSKKNTKIKECYSTANPRTQKLTLLKKSKSTVPYRTFKNFRFFLPPKCREVYKHRRRFPTPYPSREGLYGVRYPNTLKLVY